MRRTLSRSLSLLIGLGMIFIGLRFLLAPRLGAEGFGIFLPPTDTQYAFHYAKGIRDVFSGLLLALFAGLGYDRPLAWVLLLGALIPSVDLAIVRAQPTASLALELPHLIAIGLLLPLAASLFTTAHPASPVGVQRPEQLTRQRS
ncbi:DUF4267 domain-containing protein [Hymenobacter crusticola]|uniref:DUF4267 domain-containing protein n=1 Tax=Hymenobacter crusticola TaxID=1770526 RepID=A0A243W9R3_9BACT|nr:DUF4267 domain-containing protein [Hymenobacter crusticola]OUJ72167.1 hypothetical protein BXP70_19450 [Hymenobacter crusticola]